MNVFEDFFQPLFKANKRDLAIWGVIVLVCTLKITVGDQGFFVKHWGDLYESKGELDWNRWIYHHWGTLVTCFLVPFFLVHFGLKMSFNEVGLQLGDWRYGLKATLVGCTVAVGVVYLSTLNAEHQAFYPKSSLVMLSTTNLIIWCLHFIPNYIGWEYMFRGFIGLGLKDKYGVAGAMGLQITISTLLHLGKPFGETWGTIVGGLYLGLLTYRTRSILWPFIFHIWLGIVNTYMAGTL